MVVTHHRVATWTRQLASGGFSVAAGLWITWQCWKLLQLMRGRAAHWKLLEMMCGGAAGWRGMLG
ncbi:hypothetical protein F3Y22_tig00116961pilonHSYRG00044 [Hibiscus syriacus]|uniref:Uncharacterized protein n=1 Tax=Hibiscus syriacus TaxID=106335 RepID=A0A6A2WKM6_HIBSY|nr:hypothetical protein F3Y22_tig00116961pilonHSYRG00044 [Hibiscus syriacus]